MFLTRKVSSASSAGWNQVTSSGKSCCLNILPRSNGNQAFVWGRATSFQDLSNRIINQKPPSQYNQSVTRQVRKFIASLFFHVRRKKASAKHEGIGWGGEQSETFFPVPTPYLVKSHGFVLASSFLAIVRYQVTDPVWWDLWLYLGTVNT